MDVIIENGVVEKPHRKLQSDPSAYSRINRKIRSVRHAVFRNPFLAGHRDYLFIGHPRRKIGDDGTFWDIYCDPIINYLGPDKCMILEQPWFLGNPNHAVPPHTKHLAYTDFCELYTRCKRRYTLLLNRLRGISLSISEVDRNQLVEIEGYFQDAFGVTLSLVDRVENRYKWHFMASQRYTDILKRIKPRIVFIVCSYGKEDIVQACKTCLIPSVELQHGVNSQYHMGYSYPNGASKSLFPDYFMSFGKFWEQEIALPLPRVRTFTVGYPYLEEQMQVHQGRGKKKQILFISQGTIGSELSEFAVALEKSLPEDWRIVFKLHNGEVAEWRQRYVLLSRSPITVIEGDSPPLYELMAESDVQVGVYSTALFEGIAFACRTYLVDLPGIEHAKRLVDSGVAHLVNAPEEIDLADSSPENNIVREHIFASNWRGNLDHAIEKVLKNDETKE